MAVQHDLDRRGAIQFMFETSPAQLLVADAESFQIIVTNRSMRSALGLSATELRGKSLLDVVPAPLRDRLERLIGHVRRRGYVSREMRTGTNPDQLFRVDVACTTLTRPTLCVNLRDLSGYQALEAKATAAEGWLVSAIEALPDGFALFDADDRLVICNERFRGVYPKAAPAMVRGAKFEDIMRAALAHNEIVDAIAREDDWIKERLARHIAAETSFEQQLSDGRWIRVEEKPTREGGRVGLRVDVTGLKRQNEALEDMLRTDELTGLPNRRGLSDRLNELASGPLAVLHVDLTRFRLVNSLHGLRAGDSVLKETAARLLAIVEKQDLARVGVDEFVVLLPGVRDAAAAKSLGKTILHGLSQPINHQSRTCQVGACIGIALRGEMQVTLPDRLLENATIALNAAKVIGPEEVTVFHDEMRDRVERSNALAEEIKQGLARGELRPFFQPQVNTETGEVVGFEALIRWHNPRRGLVPAFEFLAVAQKAGLTEAIDDLVLDQSCQAVRKFKEWGLPNPTVSVNVSLTQISDPRILGQIRRCMRAHDIGPENLRIELLESTLLDDRTPQIIENIHALIAEGIAIELDDFGTGHAAISTLRLFNVSQIKVDRSLVQQIDRDDELQVITSAVIELARSLGISALAEGVETQAEQAKLKEIGCHCAQGYLHSKPMPLEDIPLWLARRGVEVAR